MSVFIQSNITRYNFQEMPTTIESGSAYTNTGNKAIAFVWDSRAQTVKPSQVLYNIHSGMESSRCSIQQGAPIVLRLDWGRDYQRQDIDFYAVHSVSDKAIVTALQKFFNENADYAAWFAPQPRRACYLPNSDKNAAQISKEKKLQDLKNNFGVELPNTTTSPSAGLNFKPQPLPSGWELWVNKYNGHDGSLVGISNGFEWYFSNGNGKAKLIENWDINGSQASNYAHTDTVHYYGPTLGEYLQMNRPPMWAKYLVRVETGAYTRDHHSYGVKLDIFTLPKI